jgi:large repetitive protein
VARQRPKQRCLRGGTGKFVGDEWHVITPGNDNTATVDGNFSHAFAGTGNDNTATVTGDGLTADTGPGDGNTVTAP